MNRYKDELKSFLGAKAFMVCIILIALLCYGFAAVNVTVGIDDLEGTRYIGSGNDMLSAGRFATVLWSVILGYGTNLVQNGFRIDVMAVVMLLWASINLSILFRRIAVRKISMAACTVFACILVSYPLINEIWEYTGANLNVCGGSLLVSFALLLIHEQIHEASRCKPWRLPVACGLMMLVCAGYESVVAVYIFFVFAVLALQVIYGSQKEKTLGEVFRQGMIYAAVLAVGLILRLVVHQIILGVMDIERVINGATQIYWGTMPAMQVIRKLIIDWIQDYILRGIVYFPLTELCVAAVVLIAMGVAACRRHGRVLLVPGVGMFLSLVSLSLFQGVVSPYRTCQVFGAFVAFVAMMVVVWVENRPKKGKGWARKGVLLLCGCLCFYQASYMNYYLTWNHVRSEEEAYVIRDIGTELHQNFDIEKPVIFVGGYTLSENTMEAVSVPEDSVQWKLYRTVYLGCYTLVGETYDQVQLNRDMTQTNVNSVIEWGIDAYEQEGMQNLFAYYGFPYVKADFALLGEAARYVEENQIPAYPSAGYIRDVGDYIIIHIE